MPVSPGSFRSAFLALLAAAACAGEPAWFANRPADDKNLYGVGVGKEAATSKSAAQADLVEQLIVSVSSSRETTTAASTKATDGKVEASLAEDYRQQVKSASDVPFLAGAEIAKQETVDGAVFTLLSLERKKFTTAALARVADLDRVIGKGPEAQPDPLTGAWVEAARGIVMAASEREILRSILIGQGAAVPDSPVSALEVRRLLGGLIHPPVLELVKPGEAPGVRDALLDCADGLGYTIALKPEEARYRVNIVEKKRMVPIDREEGSRWYKVTITGAVTVTNKATKQVVGSLEASASATSTLSEADGQAKAREALIKKLGDEIRRRLLPIFIADRTDKPK